jgi:hypothetical protein
MIIMGIDVQPVWQRQVGQRAGGGAFAAGNSPRQKRMRELAKKGATLNADERQELADLVLLDAIPIWQAAVITDGARAKTPIASRVEELIYRVLEQK